MSQPITIMEELSGDLAEMLATRTGMDEERVIKMHAAFLGVWTNIYIVSVSDKEVLSTVYFYKFLDQYPSGEMTRDEFTAFVLEKDENETVENAEALFEIFDKDSNGTMDFQEFLMARQANKVNRKCVFLLWNSFHIKSWKVWRQS